MYLDKETYEQWRLAAALVREHASVLRIALVGRIEQFDQAAEEAQKGHDAGALSEPATEGHVRLIDNAGLAVVAETFRQEREMARRVLNALDKADRYWGDEQDEWEEGL